MVAQRINLRITFDGRVLLRSSFDKGIILIGRGSEADVLLPSDRVSRSHCQLELVGDSCILQDLGSLHGTRVNGVRIDRHILVAGDSIQIDDFAVWVELVPKCDETAADRQLIQDRPTLR